MSDATLLEGDAIALMNAEPAQSVDLVFGSPPYEDLMKCLYPNNKGATAYRKGCRCRRCKDSNNRWQKDYHRRHPGKAIAYFRRRMYGIEPEEYDRLLASQGGKCAICKRPGQVLVIDHCHHSRKVRGLLCHQCNTAIGLLHSDVKNCRAATEYLSETQNG